MIKNFLDKYGIEKLRDICDLFVDQVSNQTIAETFGVTRQRVHQWQKCFTIKRVNITNDVAVALSSSNKD